ncbi:extracellular solute-binding protein [Psychrobacter sp. I-STPA6b]|uniref:extracellular solute-binding protein n=1 Tax=Psychrobacter sp. I-STPA6b TaxID=2585718 RepID=UPI0039B45B1C
MALGILTLPVQADPITRTTLAHNSTTAYEGKSHMPYANPDAPKGGTLSMSTLGTFNSANKWMTTGVPMAGTDLLYDTLMSGSLNEAFTMYPQLAEKVTYDPDDPSWIIYHINPKAKFWDGSDVTAEDVKATFDALLSKGPMFIRSYLGDIKEVQVLDKYRAKFIFNSADNKEILLTVGQFPVFAKTSIDKNFETLSLTPLMGSGPYKLGSIQPGQSVTYVRDPNYWGQSLAVNQGRYNFDKVKYVYYLSDEVAFEGFKSGQYQFRQENKASNWAKAYNFPAIQAGMVKKERVTMKNPVAMQGLVMNQRRPLFQDIKVRQALTRAFDFKWLNKTLFYEQYEQPQSYFYGSELEATGKPSVEEMAVLTPLLADADSDYRQQVLNEWHLPQSNGDGFNREGLLEARKLLLSAGFYYKDMHLYQPNGQRARIEILVVDGSSMERVLLSYVRHLQRLGFDASIQNVDAPQYLERKRHYDYDMIVDVFAQSLSPGAEQLSYWGSESADDIGNQNTMGIKNPMIDAVIEQLIKADNREQIILYTKVLDRLLRAGYYIVPMLGNTGSNVAYWKQYRHVDKLPDNALGLDYWWVDAEAEKQVYDSLH